MNSRARSVCLLALVFALGGSLLAAGQSKVPDGTPRVSAHERGLAHFARGFYEFLPKNRSVEAAGEFEAAEREFGTALKAEPGRVETRLALARVYRVQGKCLMAAEQYQKAVELDPRNIDIYLFAAESLAEAGQYREAGDMLRRAKSQTGDAQAIQALDGYLRKLADFPGEAAGTR